jgi:hypothetical protein
MNYSKRSDFMGQLSISEIEILKLVESGIDTKYKIYGQSRMSSATVDYSVNRLLTLSLLELAKVRNKREKPVKITKKGKMALRILGNLDRVVD